MNVLKSFLFLLPYILFFQGAQGQDTNQFPERLGDPAHVHYGNQIELEWLKHHVYAFSADSMQGRDTGQPGGKMAGNYIENHLKLLGIPPIGDTTYRQTISFSWLRWSDNELAVSGEVIRHFWDYLALPAMNYNLEDLQLDEVVFVGYGIDADNYSDMPKGDFSGSTALMWSGEPKDENGQYWVSGTSAPSEWSQSLDLKLKTAAERGFSTVLLVEPELRTVVNQNRRQLFRPIIETDPVEPEEGMPGLIYLSTQTFEKLLPEGKAEMFSEAIAESAEKVSQLAGTKLSTDLHFNLIKNIHSLEDDNILGYIEGIDPERKHELIVLSAHYDHLGYSGDEIFHGANDNASGTSAVMEMGRAFQAAKKAGDGPARSVLLLLLTGEERGLLGSRYYVENPVFPLENTIANINIDMLGRMDEKHEELGIENYIYPIGSDRLSTEFHEILLKVNENYSNIHLDFTYNDPEDPNRYYFRSDHYNFARNGIPAIFYFNGMHDDYHLATDTPDKMNFESMTAVTRHIFHLAWELANREEAIQADLLEE